MVGGGPDEDWTRLYQKGDTRAYEGYGAYLDVSLSQIRPVIPLSCRCHVILRVDFSPINLCLKAIQSELNICSLRRKRAYC